MKRKWKAPTDNSAKDQKSPHVDDFSAQNNAKNNSTSIIKEGGSSGFGDSFNPRGKSNDINDPNFTRERGLFTSELNEVEKKAVLDQAKAESLSPDRGNKSSETSGAGNPRKPLSLFGSKKEKRNVFDPFGRKKSNTSNSGPAAKAEEPKDSFTLGANTN